MLMLIMAQVLKEEWLEITGFAHSQTTNKLVNKAANDPPGLASKIVKNRPLASLEKNK